MIISTFNFFLTLNTNSVRSDIADCDSREVLTFVNDINSNVDFFLL